MILAKQVLNAIRLLTYGLLFNTEHYLSKFNKEKNDWINIKTYLKFTNLQFF